MFLKCLRSAVAALAAFAAVGCGPDATGLPFPGSCPYIINSSLGFSVTLPCGVSSLDPPTQPTGVNFSKFWYDSRNVLYGIIVFPADTVFERPSEGRVRFDGMMRTGSGDRLVVGTYRGDIADQAQALGGLANGGLFIMSVMLDNTTASTAKVTFSTIDFENTNGTLIDDAENAGTPTRLAAPVGDTIVLFNDGTAWSIHADSRLQVTGWESGDYITIMKGTKFGVETFLTKISEWVSVPATFIETVQTRTIASIADIQTGGKLITLSNDAKWTVSESDEFKLVGWGTSDQVAVVNTSGTITGGIQLFRLLDGKVVNVQPG